MRNVLLAASGVIMMNNINSPLPIRSVGTGLLVLAVGRTLSTRR